MPRGLKKSGAMFGSDKVVTDNPATWTSRYGSVVISNIGSVVFEGVNENGLSAHASSLPQAQYGQRDVKRQGLQMGLWVPHVLNNVSTVDEAIALLDKIQPVPVVVDNLRMKLSLSIEDSPVNSAIIEYVDTANKKADLVIHKGRQYTVTSNATPLLRFVRGSSYRSYLSKMTPCTMTEARASSMSVIRNLSNPIGAPGTRASLNDETDWKIIHDLTNRQLINISERAMPYLDS